MLKEATLVRICLAYTSIFVTGRAHNRMASPGEGGGQS